ncbi:hypothetical protein [Mucilaginibacter arboris]|uniref:Uncharacterized protein n=1 Tax=Mucilaginibacter arboris TaxID=2682090 RepID=A0A7K1T130_9SPHI|nr:hypothetical protein [Mucilaginibacter arboris]MVN23276.1 hypothetical protein [Mucilaginibacter arboris]
MKKSIIISIISMVLLMVTLPQSKVFAIIKEADLIAEMKYQGWTVSSNRFVDLKEGESCSWWYKSFFSNHEYKIVAFSEDDDVTDIDIEVQYTDGTSYRKDDDNDDLAVVQFNCYTTKVLGVRITNYASDSYYASRCKFIVFYR